MKARNALVGLSLLASMSCATQQPTLKKSSVPVVVIQTQGDKSEVYYCPKAEMSTEFDEVAGSLNVTYKYDLDKCIIPSDTRMYPIPPHTVSTRIRLD